MRRTRLLSIIIVFSIVMSILFSSTEITNNRTNAATLDLSSITTSVDQTGIEGFVTRLYKVCLGRTPDAAGLGYWSSCLIEREATGCSVAYGFISSPEFQNKKATNQEYITYLYEAFFDRSPDASGFNYWVYMLDKGMTREAVFCGFANSPEFARVCANYGVIRGYHVANNDYQKNAMVNLFVERLYNVVLGRSCDEDGMAYWTLQLVNRTQSGCQVAYGFVFSKEFIDLHLCNDHYVETLYEAFMGRSSDPSGKAHWISQLENKVSREVVFNGFAISPEFSNICKSYGITAGTINVSLKGTYISGDCSYCALETNPTVTSSPTITAAPNATATPAANATPKPTATATTKPTATPTSKPTATPTSKPTATPTTKPTATPTATPTSTPAPTPTEALPTGIHYYKNSPYTENMGTAVIVIPSNSTAEEQYSAAIIQKAITELDGYTPSIINDATRQGSTNKREISVGNTNRPHGTSKYSSDGSYSIKAYTNGVSITGVGERGLIDGCLYFLQLSGGYFWLSWDYGMQSNQDCFKYSANMSYDYERAFEFTDVDLNYWQGSSGTNRTYSLSYGLNGTFANVQMSNLAGYQNWYLSSGSSYYGYLQPGHAHTLLAEYFTPDDLTNHPEWFIDQPANTEWTQRQVCTSEPGVYERIKEHAFAMLDNPDIYDPNAQKQIICIAQSDNGLICHCDTCNAYRSAHYKDSSDYQNDNPDEVNAALYLDLCNRLSADIKAKGIAENKNYDNVYVDMLAYIQNKVPPVNMSIDDHVIIRFAPIERCYSHSLYESQSLDKTNGCYRNNEMVGYLNGWSALCKASGAELWIWEYTVNFEDTYAPFPNILSMIEDIKYYSKLGVNGIYLQNSDRMNKLNTEYGDLRIYILSVLLRDPNADVTKEIEFFLNEFYGDAGEYIWQTLEILTSQARKHNCGSNCLYPGMSTIYKGNTYFHNIWYRDEVMDFLAPVSRIYNNDYSDGMDAHNGMSSTDVATVDTLYSKALSAVANDPEHLYNVQRTMLGWRLVKSVMKVSEFSNAGTYLQKNKELYNDVFVNFGMKDYSLVNPGVPGTSKLDQTPDNWK